MEESNIAEQTLDLASQLGKGLTISVSKKAWKKSVEDYRRAVVIKLATGEGFSVFSLANVLKKAWVVGDTEVDFEEIPGNMAVAKFKNERKIEEVVEGGPWSFNNTLVLIRRWVIGTRPENLDFSKVQIWLQIHSIPQELMNDEVTKEIAEGVGKVIRGRQEQDGVKKRLFARYKIEVGINEQFPEGATVNLEDGETDPFWVTFKFERLPPRCEGCKLISHRTNACPVSIEAQRMEEEAARLGVVNACKEQMVGITQEGKNRTPSSEKEGERSEQNYTRALASRSGIGCNNEDNVTGLELANQNKMTEMLFWEAERSTEEGEKGAKSNEIKGKGKVTGPKGIVEDNMGCIWAGGGLNWAEGVVIGEGKKGGPVQLGLKGSSKKGQQGSRGCIGKKQKM